MLCSYCTNKNKYYLIMHISFCCWSSRTYKWSVLFFLPLSLSLHNQHCVKFNCTEISINVQMEWRALLIGCFVFRVMLISIGCFACSLTLAVYWQETNSKPTFSGILNLTASMACYRPTLLQMVRILFLLYCQDCLLFYCWENRYTSVALI